MPTQLLLHLQTDQDGSYRWLRHDSKHGASPMAMGELATAAQQTQGAHVVVLVPTTLALVAHIPVPTANRQKILKLAPFALEDQMAIDVEEAHIAVGARDAAGKVAVVAVARAQMQAWQTALREAGIRTDFMVADVAVLPTAETAWQLYIDGHTALIRTPTQDGLACDAENYAVMLNLLAKEQDQDSEAKIPLKVWNATGADFTLAEELPQFSLEIENIPGLLDLAARQGVDTKRSINLLQGEYSQREQLGKYLRPWRVAASLVGVWFVVQFANAIIDGRELEKENDALKAQVTKVFKQAMPEVTKIVNAKVQMERKLAELKGSGNNQQASFLSLIGESAQAFKDTNGIILRSIRYKPSELEVELEVPTIQDLDQLKQRLATQAKLTVEIQSASAKDNKVQGRLNIKGTA